MIPLRGRTVRHRSWDGTMPIRRPADLVATRRGAGPAACLLGVLAVAACGSSSTPGSSGSTGTPTPASTPGPSSVHATLTGDGGLSGALVAGTPHFVYCGEPSLSGPTIVAYENTADPTVGTLLSIRAGSILVRIARGSGTSYTQRTFSGSGVTHFDATSGAMFSGQRTESPEAGANKGTLGTISSISGSVSCGTYHAGGGSITIAGDTAGGALSGSLTEMRVLCITSGSGHFVSVSALGHVGSTTALLTVGGGTNGNTLFVGVQTAVDQLPVHQRDRWGGEPDAGWRDVQRQRRRRAPRRDPARTPCGCPAP